MEETRSDRNRPSLQRYRDVTCRSWQVMAVCGQGRAIDQGAGQAMDILVDAAPTSAGSTMVNNVARGPVLLRSRKLFVRSECVQPLHQNSIS